MAKAKVFQYRIQYVDNTYQLVEWTKTEFNNVYHSIEEGKTMVICGDDMFRINDIRAIVFLPPLPEPTEAEKKAQAEQQLSEWGFVDAETAQWLKDNGIDLTGGGN
jgi:hypothetical protein